MENAGGNMVGFLDWCDQAVEDVGPQTLHILSARQGDTPQGCHAVAAIVPGHYAAEERVAAILRRIGKPAAAAFIEGKLPTSKSMRSGDLGEILATEYISTLTPFGEMRCLRGFSVNPWATGSRFIVSHRLLTDEV